ncbi:MAG TPA: hypothetical protein VNT79_05225, partial [Phycisphaerae bacterium]|nr:hypothetical protein [Phycisphaerae bacterium]
MIPSMPWLFALWTVLLFSATGLSFAQGAPGDGPSSPPVAEDDLRGICDNYWEFQLRTQPERATYLGDHRYDDMLTDYSLKARDEELAFFRSLQDRLKRLDSA